MSRSKEVDALRFRAHGYWLNRLDSKRLDNSFKDHEEYLFNSG
jgi:hypothetical protein